MGAYNKLKQAIVPMALASGIAVTPVAAQAQQSPFGNLFGANSFQITGGKATCADGKAIAFEAVLQKPTAPNAPAGVPAINVVMMRNPAAPPGPDGKPQLGLNFFLGDPANKVAVKPTQELFKDLQKAIPAAEKTIGAKCEAVQKAGVANQIDIPLAPPPRPANGAQPLFPGLAPRPPQ